MLFFIGFLSVVLVSAQSAEYTFDTKYIDIPLDHFNYRENTTFTLKYLVNETYFKPNGTIFLYAGNEGNIEMFAQNSGFMFDIAPEFDALIVFAEHRYYGESLPFGNLSYSSPEYMGYLSTSQALADFVYLINELQNIYNTEERKLPVVAFGGSYGGMLAAWLKMKYPNSIVGAIASSAPIWMFKGQSYCGEFYRIVTEDFTTLGSENCAATIKNSWEIIRSFTANETGKAELAELWNFCTPFETDENIESLIGWLSNIYAILAETNYPYPTDFVAPLPGNPIKEFCDKIDATEADTDLDVLTAIGEALQIYTNYTQTAECNSLDRTSEQLGEYAWYFQECTEMIMPFCSMDTDMFESFDYNFESFSNECYTKYGVRPRNEEVPLLIYGNKDLSTAKNIVFSNGRLDPWSGYGVLTNVTSDIVSIVISEGVHHSELRAGNENDPESVKEARLIQIHHIDKWVKEHYNYIEAPPSSGHYVVPSSNVQYAMACFLIIYLYYLQD